MSEEQPCPMLWHSSIPMSCRQTQQLLLRLSMQISNSGLQLVGKQWKSGKIENFRIAWFLKYALSLLVGKVGECKTRNSLVESVTGCECGCELCVTVWDLSLVCVSTRLTLLQGFVSMIMVIVMTMTIVDAVEPFGFLFISFFSVNTTNNIITAILTITTTLHSLNTSGGVFSKSWKLRLALARTRTLLWKDERLNLISKRRYDIDYNF